MLASHRSIITHTGHRDADNSPSYGGKVGPMIANGRVARCACKLKNAKLCFKKAKTLDFTIYKHL